MVRDLGVDLCAEADRVFARADLRFAPQRLCVALRVVDELQAQLARPAKPCLRPHAEGERAADRPDDHPDHYPDEDQHDSLLGWLSRRQPRLHLAQNRRTGCPESMKRADTAARSSVGQDAAGRPRLVSVLSDVFTVSGSAYDSEKAVMQAKRRMKHPLSYALHPSFAKSAPVAATIASSPKPRAAT